VDAEEVDINVSINSSRMDTAPVRVEGFTPQPPTPLSRPPYPIKILKKFQSAQKILKTS
jgi:hypothetical protein